MEKFKRTPNEKKIAKELKRQWGVEDFAIDDFLEAEMENEKILQQIKKRTA